MREIWIDGYGLFPGPLTPLQIERTRVALRSVVEDDSYWVALLELSTAKNHVSEIMTQLKGECYAKS